MELKKNLIAKTGVTVSAMGLGTVKLGRDQEVKYPQGFTIPKHDHAVRLLQLCLELGVTTLDTAPAYGSSEQRLGEIFAKELKGQRQAFTLCSKAGEDFDEQGSRFCFTPEHINLSLRRSLKRLGTDYLDIFLIHSDGNDKQLIQREGVLEVLSDLKKQGLIRASGMSTKTQEGGLLALQQSDCAMVTYNLEQPQEQAVLDYAKANKKGILVKKALASGHLCQTEKQKALQESMDFVFSHQGVSSTIVGTINEEHLRENIIAICHALKNN